MGHEVKRQMKKIGIITFHRAINYGAVLQVYALQQKVIGLGFDAEIIDYGLIGAVNAPFARKNILQKLLNSIVRPMNFIWRLVRRIESVLFKKDMEKQAAAFSAFERDHLKMSTNAYHTDKDLEGVEAFYDGIITGSDQVWNPLITQSDMVYFLNFVGDNNKKISYAPSFGSDSIPEDLKDPIAHEINKIKYLSVRERTGAEIIKSISNREAQIVLDPTLLLRGEEWMENIPENKINVPYIFCYALLNDPEISRFCKHLSKVTGYKIVRLSLYHDSFQRTNEYFDTSTTYVNDSGPLEFLSYLSNASIVVTNSFHGTVFSINFKKDFFVLLPEHSVERIVNTLDLYGLSDRILKNGSEVPAKNDIEIDYSKVWPTFNNEKNKSIDFLENSLNSL